MKRTEVRIGNYVEVENLKTGHREVAPVNQLMILNWNEGKLYRYHPINLTEEWLDRLGFDTSNWFAQYVVPIPDSIGYNLGFSFDEEPDGIMITCCTFLEMYDNESIDGMYIDAVIHHEGVDSVHKVQNLYFALTNGEELTADTHGDMIDDEATRILKNIIEP